MKMPIHATIPVPTSLRKHYSCDRIEVLVMLDVPAEMLPLFCPGSIHNIGIAFPPDQQHLTGNVCTTRLLLRINRPFTEWLNNGAMTYYRLHAQEESPVNPEEAKFKAYVNAMFFSSNVYVLSTTCGDDAAREANRAKAQFLE